MHYWWTMVLPGIGWNVTGHRIIAGGIVLFNFGWHSLIAAIVPVTVVIFVITRYYFKTAVGRS